MHDARTAFEQADLPPPRGHQQTCRRRLQDLLTPRRAPPRRAARLGPVSGRIGAGAGHRSIIRSASEAVMIPTMRALRETSMHFVNRSSGTSTFAGVS